MLILYLNNQKRKLLLKSPLCFNLHFWNLLVLPNQFCFNYESLEASFNAIISHAPWAQGLNFFMVSSILYIAFIGNNVTIMSLSSKNIAVVWEELTGNSIFFLKMKLSILKPHSDCHNEDPCVKHLENSSKMNLDNWSCCPSKLRDHCLDLVYRWKQQFRRWRCSSGLKNGQRFFYFISLCNYVENGTREQSDLK